MSIALIGLFVVLGVPYCIYMPQVYSFSLGAHSFCLYLFAITNDTAVSMFPDTHVQEFL